jgi:hypothetical protein
MARVSGHSACESVFFSGRISAGSGATTLTWSMESLLTVLAAAQLLLCGVAFSRESSLRIFRIEIPVRFSPV